MSERDRQRRLRIQNRLEELRAKYGPLEPAPMPCWLNHAPVDSEAQHLLLDCDEGVRLREVARLRELLPREAPPVPPPEEPPPEDTGPKGPDW